MIKISVFYPAGDSTRFDMDYYCNKHMPMVQQKTSPACKRFEVDQGLAGAAPGTPPIYAAVGHLYYDSIEDMQAAFAPHAAEFMADVPNYTNIQPLVQISEIKG